MTREPPAIDLPQPARERWQPLRLGLIELYHYDVEEFEFRDGHLLLRGNNGTGKSKVLSLTLPFLLDANLTAARVEPDGDRNKRMEWNLLMGGRYERRIGYTWIELGRLDEAGHAETLTLGCGLRAVAGRSGLDSWYFTTEQRIGADLWLTTAQRTALTRERLIEAIGTRGHVFQSAQDYKRAVDERLFRLGEDRYAALVNTLIQLRQPQLSKQPDEERLSNALTEALTPLDREALEVVAEAMAQLEELHRELEELQAMRKAVAAFGERYERYAQVATRRRARVLRQAQTLFDEVSRELNAAEQTLESTRAALARWQQEMQVLDDQLAADGQRVSVLETHPTMQDARRIADARQLAEVCSKSFEEAEARLADARSRLAREEAVATRRRETAKETRSHLVELESRAASLAVSAGVGDGLSRTLAEAASPDGLAGTGAQLLDTLRSGIRGIETRRREQIAVIRKALAEVAAADRACSAARVERRRCAEAFDAATEASERALAVLRDAGAQLVASWRLHVSALQALVVSAAEDLLGELTLWVGSLSGPNPLRAALTRAWQAHERERAARRASVDVRRERLRTERREFEEERSQLEMGGTPVPPAPYTRDGLGREARPGAPLWQLVDFSPQVDEAARAGLEASLEASGLLDAWVTPGGALLDRASHDVVLVARTSQAESLAGWLLPTLPACDSAVPVSVDTVSAILASIACADGDPVTAEAWVSLCGEFRLGPARGSWSKPRAQYIGHAAREAARRLRLDEIASKLLEIDAGLAECAATEAQLEEQRARAAREQDSAPPDDALLRAQADREAAEQVRRQAQSSLGETDSRLASAEHALARARDALGFDAESLQLPTDASGIERVTEALSAYRQEAAELVSAVRAHQSALTELALQLERETQARADTESASEEQADKRRALVEARQVVTVLEESVGKAVEELLRELHLAKVARDEHKAAHTVAQRESTKATGDFRAAETRRDDLCARLDERVAGRRKAIEELQAFATVTGLFTVAVPDLALPDPGVPWGVEAALAAARRAEQALAEVPAEESDWNRIQNAISRDLQELQTAMSAQGHAATAELTDFGVVVNIIHHDRPQRPDALERLLTEDIDARRLALTAQERDILESHLEKEIAANLQRRIVETEERVRRINAELEKRPTSIGVRYRLEWQPLPEQEEGAVTGLLEARKRLLKTSPDAWSTEDRRQVGEFLQARIQVERSRDEQATLLESLSRALDYRRWHRFRVQRQQDRQWRPLSGPASSGERALGLTVPLFAAASSHYWSAHPHAPRLVLLDEAFAGIDDEARANCMALIREFDLDFVMTSEREWGCYPELPGLAICQLIRREGMDAVLVTRWTWDGRERRKQEDTVRRFPPEPAPGAIEEEPAAQSAVQLDLTS
ncbi:MAG: TIGR02680 family protein [Steroidobacteraceae bacterium]